jgi:hypothetical protein
MTSARELTQTALESLQVYAPGEDISQPDAARGWRTLNQMIDSLSNESLACFAWLTQTFTLVPGQPQYTVGPGGFINGARPLRVSDAPGSAYLLDVNQNRYLMDVLDQLAWNTITTAVADSDLPDHLFYDPQFPLGIINIWPTPDVGYTCSFLSYLQLNEFTSPDTSVSFPPGYELFFWSSLACMLKPFYQNAVLDPDVRKVAIDSKAAIKRNNIRPQIAVFDAELISRGNAVYNIYADRGAGRI